MKKLIAPALLLVMGITLFCGCSVATEKTADNLKYIVSDGEVTVTGQVKSSVKTVIPEKIEGLPVTAIADGAFFRKTTLKEVVFEGNNLKRIGKEAFSGTAITALILPESVNFLDDRAFASCAHLKTAMILGSLAYLGEAAFFDDSKLSSVAFYGTVEKIGARAFMNLEELESLFLPKVKEIGDYAFANLRTLTGEVVIGAEKIGAYAFVSCPKLTSVKALNCKSLGKEAFSGCYALESAAFSKDLTLIPEACFEGCNVLKSFSAGKLEKLEKYAFNTCAVLDGLEFSDTCEILRTAVNDTPYKNRFTVDDDDEARIIDGVTYKRTFFDDFSGNEIDPTKWEKCPEWNRRGAFWKDENSYVDGCGNLILETSYEKTPNGRDRIYYMGAIRSNGKFSQKYGYFEIRCRLSTLHGFWSAFWLMPQVGRGMAPENGDNSGRDGTEIDIYESPFYDTSEVNFALHYDGYGDFHKSVSSRGHKEDLYLGMHTFALKWTENAYEYYIDGVKAYEITDPNLISQVEEFMKVTVEVGTWAGSPEYRCYPTKGLVADSVKVYSEVK